MGSEVPDFSTLRTICSLANKVEKALSEASRSSISVSIEAVSGYVATVKHRGEVIYSSPVCHQMNAAVDDVERFYSNVTPERLAALIKEVNDRLADRPSYHDRDLRHVFRYSRFGNTPDTGELT